MRILHTIRSVNPEGGGLIEAILQMSRVHLALGHQVEVVSLDAPEDVWVAACELKVHALGPPRGKFGFAPGYVPWLRGQAPRFDCVIVNGCWQYNAFGTWRALRGGSVPYFVFPHGMLDPWFKRTYPLKHLKKWLYWPWAEYRVLRDARAVFFTCDEERRLARESFWLYRCTERIVPLGIARPPGEAVAQKEAFLQLFPQLRGRPCVVFLGRLHVKKGCDLLLRAFAEVAPPDTFLVMAGPDQMQPPGQLQKLAAELGLGGRVIWPGMLRGDLKWGALRAAALFALPSHQENFGIAVVEALACGVPVLISDKVNIWREIAEEAVGWVGNDDLPGTIASLRHWQGLDASARVALGEKAKASFEKRFEIERAAVHFLESLLAAGVKG